MNDSSTQKRSFNVQQFIDGIDSGLRGYKEQSVQTLLPLFDEVTKLFFKGVLRGKYKAKGITTASTIPFNIKAAPANFVLVAGRHVVYANIKSARYLHSETLEMRNVVTFYGDAAWVDKIYELFQSFATEQSTNHKKINDLRVAVGATLKEAQVKAYEVSHEAWMFYFPPENRS